MRVVKAFYDLNRRDRRPPSAEDLALALGLTRFTVYKHLQKAAEYGLIEHRLEAGKSYGTRGIVAYHPVKSIRLPRS